MKRPLPPRIIAFLLALPRIIQALVVVVATPAGVRYTRLRREAEKLAATTQVEQGQYTNPYMNPDITVFIKAGFSYARISMLRFYFERCISGRIAQMAGSGSSLLTLPS